MASLDEGVFGGARLTIAAKAGSRVVMCYNESDGKLCVVKAYARSMVNPIVIRSERDALQALSHPLIASCYRTAKDKAHVYFVMEAVVGGPLYRHVKRAGRLAPATARYYAAQTLVAIEYMHSKGIIHRDLKASNIMLDDVGKIRIVDFGAAATVVAGQSRNTFCGTPHCMAPEMISRSGHSYGVDWWALGIFFFEMLTGKPPFWDDDNNDDSFFKLRALILAGFDVAKASIQPDDVLGTLSVLLQTAPSRRPEAKADFRAFGLARLEDWETVVDAPAPPYCRDVGYLDWVQDCQETTLEDSRGRAYADQTALFNGF
ncbi:hypothetical protein CTAYLR_010262 [Chrysophaeum taylorii]|uniref:Protein kinase domain-containing protein n=1 Tax=Chrysophaeum taylorii TaxID=2483200 RepID=A0AAD7UHK4_9STRA|nr:hypothetical protein CTAYLR_010262 [Chrysophaeum taylorii]